MGDVLLENDNSFACNLHTAFLQEYIWLSALFSGGCISFSQCRIEALRSDFNLRALFAKTRVCFFQLSLASSLKSNIFFFLVLNHVCVPFSFIPCTRHCQIFHKVLASLLRDRESRAISEAIIFAFMVYSPSHWLLEFETLMAFCRQ